MNEVAINIHREVSMRTSFPFSRVTARSGTVC